MRLNDINFDLLTDRELVILCLKYKIIQKEQIPNLTRKELLNIIKNYIQRKLQVYGQRKRSLSTSSNLQSNRMNNISRPTIQRQTSNPITNIEKSNVVHQHNTNEIKNQSQNQIQEQGLHCTW